MGPPSADFPRALATAASIFAAFLALATGAVAEPQAPSEEEDPDIAFAEGFVGTIYQGDLELDGWTDLGGGLVAPPIFVRHYQREADGIYLALTAKEVAKASSDIPARFEVTDTLIVPPPQGGAQFTVSCVKGKDEMLRYLGVAKGREDREWWTDVRSAWEISIETGTIEPTKTKGVRCTNVSWGQ